MGILLALSGCVLLYEPLPDTGTAEPYEGETTIDAVEYGCSSDEDSWTVAVDTLGWTSGAMVSMSEDGLSYESHPFYSVEAAGNGSWDRLELELEIVADPADQERGDSTAYLCQQSTREALAWRLVVYDPDEGEVADCRVWGAELDWNALAGYSDCDTRLDE